MATYMMYRDLYNDSKTDPWMQRWMNVYPSPKVLKLQSIPFSCLLSKRV